MEGAPEEWLANFNSKIDDIRARTAEFQENLEASGVTESAPDGSITVAVAPNGSLTDLRIEESAWRGNGSELAGRIMQLARKAQRSAAVNVAEAFAPLGADSEAMHMVTGYLPEPEETDEPDETAGYSFDEQAREPGPPQPPQHSPQQPPPRPAGRPQTEPPRGAARPPRRRGEDDTEDDFGNDQIFGDDR